MDTLNTLDLLKSLTKGVNLKVEEEKEEEIEYIVNTSLRKNNKVSINNEKESVKKVEEQKEEENVKLPKKVANSSYKPKIDRGGNPFKRGPRKQKTIENINENKSNKEIIDEEVVEKEDIEEEIFEEEIIEEEAVGLNNNVNNFCIDNTGTLDSLDDIEDIKKDSKNNIITEKDINFEISNDDIIDTDIDIEDSSFDDVFVDFCEDDVDENCLENVEQFSDNDENVSKKNDLDFDNNKIEIEDFLHPVKEEELNDLFEDVKEDSNETELKNDKEEKEIKEEAVGQSILDDKYSKCVYHSGMAIEDFLRENKEYREYDYVEHFYTKDYLDNLLKQGLILKKNGKYRL